MALDGQIADSRVLRCGKGCITHVEDVFDNPGRDLGVLLRSRDQLSINWLAQMANSN